MKYTWLIDSGHGGMVDGEYVTAPAKMYEFNPGEVYYEGVGNRYFKQRLIDRLEVEAIHCIDVCPTELDVPLTTRVGIINQYHKQYKNAVLISLHSNAGGGTGFEVFTSVGDTRSDRFAQLLSQRIIDSFSGAPFRKDESDGDLDKESQFYILAETTCPALLPECLFFDNYSDYQLLIDPTFQTEYVDCLVGFIKVCENMDL